jgi:Zn-dependent peptidase ImmA (M78 family)
MKTAEHIIETVDKLVRKYHTRDPYELCQLLGIKIHYYDLQKKLKGFFYYQSRQKNIVIDHNVNGILERILVAHELGHAVLHTKIAMMHGFQEMEVFDDRSIEENEANFFAAELLLEDGKVLECLSEHTFFETAKMLYVPAALLDYKFSLLHEKGELVNSMYIRKADFLKEDLHAYVYAKSYREVKAKLISQSSCTSNSVTVDPEISSDQFEQVAMEWFQAICPKVKESTSNKYRNLLSSYILPVFGSKQLRDITHEFIETQCNFFLVSGGLKENGLSSKTVSDILSLIRNVLQFATRNGKAISCDARSIQIKRQTKEMRVLSRAEQEKLCQYLYSNLDSCNIGILVDAKNL